MQIIEALEHKVSNVLRLKKHIGLDTVLPTFNIKTKSYHQNYDMEQIILDLEIFAESQERLHEIQARFQNLLGIHDGDLKIDPDKPLQISFDPKNKFFKISSSLTGILLKRQA